MEYATYTIRPNQSLLDIAMQIYGNARSVYELLADNPQLNSITAQLYVGDKLHILAYPFLV